MHYPHKSSKNWLGNSVSYVIATMRGPYFTKSDKSCFPSILIWGSRFSN